MSFLCLVIVCLWGIGVGESLPVARGTGVEKTICIKYDEKQASKVADSSEFPWLLVRLGKSHPKVIKYEILPVVDHNKTALFETLLTAENKTGSGEASSRSEGSPIGTNHGRSNMEKVDPKAVGGSNDTSVDARSAEKTTSRNENQTRELSAHENPVISRTHSNSSSNETNNTTAPTKVDATDSVIRATTTTQESANNATNSSKEGASKVLSTTWGFPPEVITNQDGLVVAVIGDPEEDGQTQSDRQLGSRESSMYASNPENDTVFSITPTYITQDRGIGDTNSSISRNQTMVYEDFKLTTLDARYELKTEVFGNETDYEDTTGRSSQGPWKTSMSAPNPDQITEFSILSNVTQGNGTYGTNSSISRNQTMDNDEFILTTLDDKYDLRTDARENVTVYDVTTDQLSEFIETTSARVLIPEQDNRISTESTSILKYNETGGTNSSISNDQTTGYEVVTTLGAVFSTKYNSSEGQINGKFENISLFEVTSVRSTEESNMFTDRPREDSEIMNRFGNATDSPTQQWVTSTGTISDLVSQNSYSTHAHTVAPNSSVTEEDAFRSDGADITTESIMAGSSKSLVEQALKTTDFKIITSTITMESPEEINHPMVTITERVTERFKDEPTTGTLAATSVKTSTPTPDNDISHAPVSNFSPLLPAPADSLITQSVTSFNQPLTPAVTQAVLPEWKLFNNFTIRFPTPPIPPQYYDPPYQFWGPVAYMPQESAHYPYPLS